MHDSAVKAVVAHEFGRPDSFSIDDIELPELAATDVRVGVHAAGVSFVDALIAEGKYQIRPELPFVPGTEFAGTVEAVGEAVTDVAPGDRVCGSRLGGAFAEAVTAPARSIRRIPDPMSFTQAAVFHVSYATAHYALRGRADLRAGETLLVLGAGGAVGFAAVQLGKAMGAQVIASASTPAKRELAQRGGADHLVDSAAEDWRQQIKTLTDGKGVDVVLDPVGGAMTERAFRALGWQGRHLVVGFAAGSIPALPTNLTIVKGASLVGVDIRQFGALEPQRSAELSVALYELYDAGGLEPVIARTYPLDEFAAAMNAAASGELAGRIVLLP
jgi:NADPH2:quinone reductase